jgi:nucleotide-binding universal stress UspA family protein
MLGRCPLYDYQTHWFTYEVDLKAQFYKSYPITLIFFIMYEERLDDMKILLAADGSEYSKNAARFLTFLNLSPEDEITVFHVMHWSHFLYNEEAYQEALKEIKKIYATGILDSALEILRPVKARITTAVVEGSAKQAIVERAAEAGTDLVVMGARGTKGIESLFLGSVTRAVTIKSSTPVLVTKLPLSVKRNGMKILFATDGSDYAISTQDFLCSVPFPDNSEVTVLNVMQPLSWDIPLTFVPNLNERFIETIEEARSSVQVESRSIVDQAKKYLSRKFRNVRVLSVEGDPSAEILAAAESLKVDLIAVGCRGLTGISGMIGSVSRNILGHSKCAVLIGKMCGE